jgi:outer membrane beta-barrel protein
MKPVLAVLAIALCAPFAARGDEAQESGKLVAIQQRKFRLAHELEIGGMFAPLDAFYKGFAAEGAYTVHLDETWSWEILRGGYVGKISTGLQDQLVRDFGVVPTAFDSLQYYASTNLVFAPLYGKLALRNASVVHVEAFLTGGGAFGHFTSYYAAGPELGLGARVFLSRALSVRLDARDAFFIAGKSKTANVLLLSLGLSINFGGND